MNPNHNIEDSSASELNEPDDINRFNADVLIDQFQPLITAQVEQYLANWDKIYIQQLNQLITILESLVQKLESLETEPITSNEVWQEAENFFTATRSWLDTSTDEFFPVDLWDQWCTHFSVELQSLPKIAMLPVSPKSWAIDPQDTFRVRLRKRIKKNSMRWGKIKFTVRNFFRRKRLERPLAQRELPLHSFTTYFLEIPTANFLLTEWLYFLQYTAQQFLTLHHNSLEIADDLLFLEQFETAMLQPDNLNITASLEKLHAHIQTIKELLQTEQYQEETLKRYQVHKTETFDTLRQKWPVAGTVIFPQAIFSEKETNKLWQRLKDQKQAGQERWVDHFTAEKGEWQTGIDLSRLQLQTSQICSEILNEFAQAVNQKIAPAICNIQEEVSTTANNYANQTLTRKTDFKKAITTLQDTLLQSLRDEQLPHTLDILINAELDVLIKTFDSRLLVAIDALADQNKIFKKRDLDNFVPKSTTTQTDLIKKIIQEEGYAKFKKEFTVFDNKNQKIIKQVANRISEVEYAIDFNLDTALSLLEQGKGKAHIEEVHTDVSGGLNRTVAQLDDLDLEIRNLLADNETSLSKLAHDFELYLSRLMSADEGKEVDYYGLLTKLSVREKFWYYRRRFIEMLRTKMPKAYNFVIDTYGRLRKDFFRFGKMTGLVGGEPEAEERLVRFLTNTETHITALPYLYQRLFRLEPLKDVRFFTARDADLVLIQNEFDLWEQEKFASTAIIGERGCGVTSLLNVAQMQVLHNYPLLRINLDSQTIYTEDALFNSLATLFQEVVPQATCQNLDELERTLQSLENRTIVIIENLEHLFLRTTHGFDVLERFMLLISRTHQNVHWIITCSLYSWRYFTKIINIDKYIQQKIMLDALPKTAIENIILKRHRVSGYQLFFEVTEEVAKSRAYKQLPTEEAQQEHLRNLFFEQLTKLAAGNISVAILFWLRSHKSFSDDTLSFPISIDFDPSFLDQLSAEEHFTLHAILQHHTLTIEHHAVIFHQDIQQSSLLLNRMANKGFLMLTDNGYAIQPLLYRSIVQRLKSENIIH